MTTSKTQARMFGADDLPLFSGTAPRVTGNLFQPVPVPAVSADLLPELAEHLAAPAPAPADGDTFAGWLFVGRPDGLQLIKLRNGGFQLLDDEHVVDCLGASDWFQLFIRPCAPSAPVLSPQYSKDNPEDYERALKWAIRTLQDYHGYTCDPFYTAPFVADLPEPEPEDQDDGEEDDDEDEPDPTEFLESDFWDYKPGPDELLDEFRLEQEDDLAAAYS